MKSCQGWKSLPAFAAGELGRGESAEVRAHLERCPECREWVSAFETVQSSLAPQVERAPVGHPSSEELARHALGLSPTAEATRLRTHLADCPVCRREAKVAGRAVRAARPCSSLPATLEKAAAQVAGRPALAASALLGALALAAFLTLPGPSAPEPQRLASGPLRGFHTVTAPGSIEVEAVKLEAGSEVRLRAGEAVTLGGEFAIGPDATFVVELVPEAGS